MTREEFEALDEWRDLQEAMWWDDFNSIKQSFRDWLEDYELFDDEGMDEVDAFLWEARQMGVPATATAASDDMEQPDIPLQTLMFCS